MRTFRYGLEPVCLAAVALYVIHRWALPTELLRGWFHDVLFLPAAMPWFLWLERRLGLRKDDRCPSPGEIAIYFAVWSVAVEVLGPIVWRSATPDGRDVLAYAAGALICWLAWGRLHPLGAADAEK